MDKEPKIKPYLTRSDDTFVELNDRAKIANDLNADMFISFHANSASNGTVSGSETYYNRDSSKSLADVLHKHLITGTGPCRPKSKTSRLCRNQENNDASRAA